MVVGNTPKSTQILFLDLAPATLASLYESGWCVKQADISFTLLNEISRLGIKEPDIGVYRRYTSFLRCDKVAAMFNQV
jgi:hypothetical protein